MEPSTLSLILTIPFALVVLLCSLRFLLSGLRKGVWVALTYLGITLVVAGIAIPISRLLAPTVWNLLEPLAQDALPRQLSEFLSENADVAVNLFSVIGAMVAYPVLFALLSFVLRLVAGIFLKLLLTNKKTWSRTAGAGVGCIHALIYPIIFLLPLYGTLAAFVPTAQTVIKSQKNYDRTTYSYVKTVAENPVVQLAGIRPVQWFYGNLSKITIDGNTLNIADAAVGIGDILSMVQQLQEVPPAQRGAALRDLNNYVRDRVLDEPWLYTLVVEIGVDQLENLIDDPTALQWLASMEDISREDFQNTLLAVSDFFDVALIGGRLENISSAKELLKDEILMVQLETALQTTPQTRYLKELVLTRALASYMFKGDIEASQVFVTEVLANPKTREVLNMKTISTLVQLENRAAIAEYLLAHPQVDTDALSQLLVSNNLLEKIEIRRSLIPE